MQKADAEGTVTVPVPDHAELRIGTLMSIIRQSGVPRSDPAQQDMRQAGSAERPRIRSPRTAHVPGGKSGPGRRRTGAGSIASPRGGPPLSAQRSA